MWSHFSCSVEVCSNLMHTEFIGIPTMLKFLFIGGGFLANAKAQEKVKMGEHMILGGLFVQIAFFGFFLIVSIVFHRRMLSTPLHYTKQSENSWLRCMKVLYAISALIMVRSIYRVIEYIQGSDGYLQSEEAFIYTFDAALMLACCLILNFFHPSKLLVKRQAPLQKIEEIELFNGGWRSQ